MDGFLDASRGGLTELRIHGVHGTPADDFLGHPHTASVSGDRHAGFRRRWYPAGTPTGQNCDVKDVRRREAYVWGGLTSGAGSRALWLLLLPFTLLNIGFFMTPRHPAEGRALRAVRHAGEAVQRLFALSLTGTLMLAVIGAAVDLIGWQCRPDACGRRADLGWLPPLSLPWIDGLGQRVAITSLVPVALLLLLWGLGMSTWNRQERTPIPPASAPGGPLLGRRRLWNGAEPVRRLRALHVALGFGLAALLIAGPADSTPAIVAAIGVIGLSAVLTARPATGARPDPRPVSNRELQARRLETPPDRLTWGCRAVVIAAVAVYLLTLIAAGAGLLEVNRDDPALPWFVGTATTWFLVQVILLAALFTTTVTLSVAVRRLPAEPGPYRTAMFGLGGFGAAALAWFLAGGLGAGLIFRVADSLGTPWFPGRPRQPADALIVAASYWWGSVAAALTIGGAATGVVLLLVVRWWTIRRGLHLADHYGGAAKRVANTWALARLTDSAGAALGLAMVIGLLAIGAASVPYFLDPASPPDGVASPLATIGSWLMSTGVVALIVVGRQAYRSNALRRTVGIVWDVGTFWPRATHPLAAPCYAERAIPDIVQRLAWLTPGDGDRVVLSGHSQGSVIAAAATLQLASSDAANIRLVTHGSPLARLYGRFFPAYFGPRDLRDIAGTLTPAPGESEPGGSESGNSKPGEPEPGEPSGPLEPREHPGSDEQLEPGEELGFGDPTHPTGPPAPRWRNLYRPSDPIGGPVFQDGPGATANVDVFLYDPARPPGDEPPGPTYGHGDYFADPAYDQTLAELREG